MPIVPAFQVFDTLIEVGRGERFELDTTAGVVMYDMPEFGTGLHPRFEAGPRFINAGEIIVHPGPAGTMYGISIDWFSGGSYERSSFWNTDTGIFRVIGDAEGTVYGYYTGSAGPDFTNDGLFSVFSNLDAYGLYTWHGGLLVEDWETHGFEFVNSGTLTAQGARNAYGVMMYNGGLATNSGTITASGSNIVWGVLLWGHRSELFNSGSIIAIDTSGPDNSIGVYISAGLFDSRIVNSGLISARHAIVEMPVGTPYFPNGDDVIENSGQILGDITFTFGDDRIENSGLIRGNVTFVDGRDLFLGSRGLLVGELRMAGGGDWAFSGGGDDKVWGGDGDDDLHGELGADVLKGEAGDDILIGGDGDDQLIGGTGVDVLDGGRGADLLIADGGDQLIGGAGDDRLVLGAGRDVVTLGADSGSDVVEGFSVGEDRFALGGRLFTSTTVIGADTRLVHPGGSVLVRGVTGLTLAQWNGLADNGSAIATQYGGVLYGGGGEDVLIGDIGQDTLNGLDGRDWLFGDAGDDVLRGGGWR